MIGRKRQGKGRKSKSVATKETGEGIKDSQSGTGEAVDGRSVNPGASVNDQTAEKEARKEALVVTMQDVYRMMKTTLDPVTDAPIARRTTSNPPVSGRGDFITEDGQERSFNIHPISNLSVEPYRQGQIWGQILRRIRDLERQNEVARQTGPEGRKVVKLSKLRSNGVVEYEVIRQSPGECEIPAISKEPKQTERSGRRRRTKR